MIIGFLFISSSVSWSQIRAWSLRLQLKNITQKYTNANEEIDHINKRVDKILDKLNDTGWDSLTDQEEKFLTRAGKRLFENKKPD